MAPGSNKRKRPDRQPSHDDGPGRPSPHRPENLGLAQQSGYRSGRGGGRRQSRQNVASSPAGAVRNATAASPPAPTRDTPGMDASRPATPSQPAAVAAQGAEEDIEMATPAAYWYEHVTDEIVGSWAEFGRQSLQDLAKDTDDMTASIVVQELVRSALDKRLDASEAGSVIRQMIADHSNSASLEVQSFFLNVVSLLEDSDIRKPELLALVAATDIDPDVIRQELDIPLLQTLALVRSTFIQMRTRKTTNILYRQANFNLLREETEGYAKLATEYFNTANEAVLNHDISAEAAFQRITALVGSFDLDVGRVLDITLDISANLLVRAYGFFVKFYRCSSWWPDSGVLDNVKWEDQGFNAFPRWALPESERPKLNHEEEEERKREEALELQAIKEARDVRFWQRVQQAGMAAFFDIGARNIVDFEQVAPRLEVEVEPEYDSRHKEINADRRKRINENRKFMRETGTLPPSGNSDAAQLLGFKLRFYASDARGPQDTLPENLIYLVALLIKIGFISLRDLYPHLYPADDKMPEEKARLEKEKAEKEAKEKPGGGANALAMAGALTDDTVAPAVRALRTEKGASGGSTPKADKKDEEPKEELPAPFNQKLMLLKALLLIGALPEALYILGRFPWLLEVDTSLPPYLHRIARQMLSKVADSVRPLSDRPNTQKAREDLESTLARPDGTLIFRPKESKKVTRWLYLDQVDKTDGQMYRHYYTDWDQNIPVCQTIEDVFLLCNSFLGLLGVKIGQDVALHSSLIRIAKHSLTRDASQPNRERWLDLMRRLLVPALSLSKHNAGLTDEIYNLLKFFPTTTRYNIYAEWYLGKTSRLPDMRVALDYNRAEVREVLRRVTNESGKKQARALAKVSLSSPGVVMMSMISQLESYSNMIPSLVECTKYFSLLAYDVLSWCLINSLSGQGKDRMQADGMLTSPWLQYLSQFVASLFLRYPFINPSPILQYLAHQLREKNSTDLEVFEQVLTEMGGIRSDIEFNDAQVLAMSGGEKLQSQTLDQLADKRHERKVSAQRLVKALSGPGLIGQTLISIAQERRMYAYHDDSQFMPLKVLGNNLDKIQSVFAQYLEVLKTNLQPEEFEAAVPDIVSLVGEFGLEPGIAFTICRPAIAFRVTEHNAKTEKLEAEEKKRRLSQEQTKTNGDVEMQNGDHAGNDVQLTTEDSIGDKAKPDPTPQPIGTVDGETDGPWHPVLEPIIQALPAVSPQLAERVSLPFFVTFWTLSLQDVLVSPQAYAQEQKKLESMVKIVLADRSDMSALAVKNRQQTKRDIARIQDALSAEVTGRVSTYQKMKNRLSKREKVHWFSRSTDKVDIDARHIGLLQECFLPRAMLSSLDAHYSFLILKMLHDYGTPGFSTMHLLNHLMRKQELAAIIFQCTAMEAQHFGRFLCETLKLLQHWHSDKTIYDKEALGLNSKDPKKDQKLPGFGIKLDEHGEPETYLDFEDFRRLLYNWHTYLTGALQMCFESGEYMHIRNSIIVLKSVVVVFPALNFQGNNMVKHVTTISQEDARQDLKLAAMSLLGPLRNREKKWMMPQAFRLNDAAKDGARANSRGPSARPETPQPSTETPKLNAAAPDFKPTTSSGLVNGASRKESVVGIEDGEIDDEKQASEKAGDVEMKDAQVEKKEAAEASQDQIEKIVDETKEPEKPASKASTPAPLPSKPPARAANDGSIAPRPTSAQLGTRPSHDLPTRPEARPLNKQLPAPPFERSNGRYGGRGEDRFGRLDRPGEARPGSRGHSPGGRPRARTPERDPYYDQPPGRVTPRDDRMPGRPSPADARYARDDGRGPARREQPSQATGSSRPSYDSHDRVNGSMGPPSSHGPHPDRAGYISSAATAPATPTSRSASAQPQETHNESHYHENPARLALINDDMTHSRDRPGDSRSDGRGDRAMPDARPNGGRSGPTEPPRDTQARAGNPTELAPSGPRRGRLSRDLSSQAGHESSYGRLNGPQDVPSGPRPMPNGANGRGNRSFAAPQVSTSSRPNEPPQPPTPTRPAESPIPPRGPSGRPQTDRRTSGTQAEQQSSSPVSTSAAAESGPPIHPSRLAHLGSQPPPIQTNVSTSGPHSASSPATAPPLGPRGSYRGTSGAPAGPSPTVSGPPSGPASAAERQRRGDRQRQDINATLQGSGNGSAPFTQGVQFRGAAQNRSPAVQTSSAASALPIQAIASPMEPLNRRTEPVRPPSRPSSRQEKSRPSTGRIDERPTGPQDGGATEQPRGSNNAGREGRAHEEQPQRPPQSAVDERSSRGYPRDDRRLRDERDPREALAPRDTRGPPRVEDSRRPPADAPGSYGGGPPPPDWDRSGDRRGNRRDGLSLDSGRGGRGSTRPEDFRGVRREDDRRAPPPREEAAGPPPPGARKRRHEDGPAFDESKRRRSGR